MNYFHRFASRARRDLERLLALSLTHGGSHPSKRGYDAAGGGHRWSARSSLRAPNTTGLATRGAISARARHLEANDPNARAAIDAIVSGAIGSRGIMPQSVHPEARVRERLNLDFAEWGERHAEMSSQSFAGLQAIAMRGMVRDGEAFLQLGDNEDNELTITPIAPEQVDSSLYRDLGADGRIIAGIEVDARGRVRAYHVFPEAPDQAFATSLTAERVDAADMIHLFRGDHPGQLRGMSWLAPSMLALNDHNATRDAMVMQAKTQALVGGFVYSQDGTAPPFSGTQEGSRLDVELTPGGMYMLPPGHDVKFITPSGGDASLHEQLKSELRAIAVGIGCTYEHLGDLSSVNYSSIRAGMLEFRRRVESWQRQILIPAMIRRIWRRWVTVEALSGRLEAPGFDGNPRPWLSAEFITPGWPWVDPQKEIAADRDAVEAGFKSRREVVASRGRDLEQLDAEIAADPRSAATGAVE